MKFAIFVSAIFGAALSDALWAEFCDDLNCSENCGESVHIEDPGCLANEGTRHSVKFHGEIIGINYLSWHPGTNCDCQEGCLTIDRETPVCFILTGSLIAQSYSFGSGSCYDPQSYNNCPGSKLLDGNGTVFHA